MFFQLAESLQEVFFSFRNFSRWDVREKEALASGHPLSNRRLKVGGLVRNDNRHPAPNSHYMGEMCVKVYRDLIYGDYSSHEEDCGSGTGFR